MHVIDTTSFNMFQSLIGRLVTVSSVGRQALAQSFQSLIGRLVTWLEAGTMITSILFQSLIGRLVTEAAG